MLLICEIVCHNGAEYYIKALLIYKIFILEQGPMA